ncbi:MAG: site-specific DNA-methyltransferase [Nitrososphaerota archaeon]|nr:site-specific DNA-methyltransferase [Nitrososphaerota archaeon]
MASKPAKTAAPPKPIEAIVHKEAKRRNIPTRELRGFVREDETKPKALLYPRDPSLDPQLVWKGKDAQDSTPLSVPAVPIYIQEKVSPQALVDDIRLEAQKGKPRQTTLFADFNGIAFDKLVDFYHHDQNWTNRMILGDSLLVMNSLVEKEDLKGRVQAIYVDPPYGIKFGSNWQVSTRKKELRDGRPEDATRQPEQIKAFRDTWELGIHSYLAYLRDRLSIAHELLTESGSVFLQIGDTNLHLVRSLLDEVFGADNFCAIISFTTTGGQSTQLLASVCDYILWYAKDKEAVKYRQLYAPKTSEKDVGRFEWVESPDGKVLRELTDEELGDPSLIPQGWRLLVHDNITSQGESKESSAPFIWEGTSYSVPANSHWKTTPEGMKRLAQAGRLMAIGSTLRFKRFLDDFPVSPLDAVWMDTATSGFGEKKRYVVQTNPLVVARCLLMTTDPGDLILDPTCGSGTTAYAAELYGRRWITIDTSRVAVALARARLMTAKYPYFLLSDSPEGVSKEVEITGRPTGVQSTSNDIRKGFVYERVPHVTLKSIANNHEISAGKSRKEIRAAISGLAEIELRYDRPYEDPRRIRVSGPFTVESLSPHRTIDGIGGTDFDAPSKASTSASPKSFVDVVLENLRVAGVQNTTKGERLKFTRADIYPGASINAEGECQEGSANRRVAICIGPEHGTVGPDLVKEAAKEAVEGRGFDLLVVCGFAFDPYVSEEAKQYGKLTVLMARMNPDLAMGDELLKKTGSGNLFTVFGEPDLLVKKNNGTVVIEVKGVDVYDPTTGAIRSHSTDDIACWFIDTDYNGESFFVRHAYFCGGDEPYDKLKRALRADINEDAWKTIYSTVSRPFDKPKTGRIAVKVINHYGDEVLKVLKIS